MMTLDHARRILLQGGSLPELMEAVGVIASDKNGSVSELLVGLSHPECVAEQASLALYRRTGRKLPPIGEPISKDPTEWRRWLSELPSAAIDEQEFAKALGIEPGDYTTLKRRVRDSSLKNHSSWREQTEREKIRDLLVHGLSEHDRLILVLYYYEGLSHGEIAQVLGGSESIVRSRHDAAVELMRARLAYGMDQFLSTIVDRFEKLPA